MSAKIQLNHVTGLIPLRYHREILSLLSPHFDVEMSEAVEDYLSSLAATPMSPFAVTELVFRLVTEITGVENIRETKTRTFSTVFARQIAMVAIYCEIENSTYKSVGELFAANFDHASVIHAKKSIESRYSTDLPARKKINMLIKFLAEKNLTGTRDHFAKIEKIA